MNRVVSKELFHHQSNAGEWIKYRVGPVRMDSEFSMMGPLRVLGTFYRNGVRCGTSPGKSIRAHGSLSLPLAVVPH
jgi:hypothetical protein